jgi:hypothetical protein
MIRPRTKAPTTRCCRSAWAVQTTDSRWRRDAFAFTTAGRSCAWGQTGDDDGEKAKGTVGHTSTNREIIPRSGESYGYNGNTSYYVATTIVRVLVSVRERSPCYARWILSKG